ncbi:hypothetical protein Bhyg_02947, partial [Pseudolycoriella hygida]
MFSGQKFPDTEQVQNVMSEGGIHTQLYNRFAKTDELKQFHKYPTKYLRKVSTKFAPQKTKSRRNEAIRLNEIPKTITNQTQPAATNQTHEAVCMQKSPPLPAAASNQTSGVSSQMVLPMTTTLRIQGVITNNDEAIVTST